MNKTERKANRKAKRRSKKNCNNKNFDVSQFEAAVALGLMATKFAPCLLCGNKPYATAIFSPAPRDKEKFNVPVNKDRIFPYALCKECFSLPNKMELVENVCLTTPTKVVDLGKEKPIFNTNKF